MKVHQYVMMSAPTASPYAAIAALDEGEAFVTQMVAEYDRRRRLIVEGFRAIGLPTFEPRGAFYAFPDVSAYVGKKTPEGSILDDDVQLCDWLVEVGKVAVVPGSGFGAPGFVRLSYACSMKNIEDGVGRLAKALGSLT
jgi:aspartate/methionine/tyrosine aminotransferase